MKKRLLSLFVALTLTVTASITLTTQVSAATIAGAKQLYHLAVEDQLFGSYDWGGTSGIAFPSNSMAVAYPAMYAPKVKNDLYNGGGWNSSGNIIRVKNYISVKSLGDVYMDSTSIGYGESSFARKVQLWKISSVADNTNNSQITTAMANISNWSKVAEVTIVPNETEALGAGSGLNWTNLATPVSMVPNEVYVVLTQQGAGAAYGVWGNPRPNEINNVLAVHPDNMSGANKEIASYSDFATGGATIGIFDGNPVEYVNGVMGTMYSGANFRYDITTPPTGDTSKQLYHLAIENQLFGSYDWGGSGVVMPANSMAAYYGWGAKTKSALFNGGGWNSSGNVVRVMKNSYIKSLGDVYMDSTSLGYGESSFARGVQLWKISGVADNNNNTQITNAMANAGNWTKIAEVNLIPDKAVALSSGNGFNWVDLPSPVMVKANEVYVIIVQQGAGAAYGVWGNPKPNEINNVLAIHPDNLSGGPEQISNLNDFGVSGATIGSYNGNQIEYLNGVMGQMYSGGNFKYDYTSPVSFGKYTASLATNTLEGIEAYTMLSDVASEITGSAGMQIKDSSGIVINDLTRRAATGMKLEIASFTTPDIYEMSVKGDVSGDGIYSIADLAQVKSHLLYISRLQGVYLDAGDMTSKGTVTIGDLLAIKKILTGDAIPMFRESFSSISYVNPIPKLSTLIPAESPVTIGLSTSTPRWQRYMLSAFEGLANRKQARVFLNWEDSDTEWMNRWSANNLYGFTPVTKNASDVYNMIINKTDFYNVKGILLYDDSIINQSTWSMLINVYTGICGAESLIPVPVSQRSNFSELPIIFDATSGGKSLGRWNSEEEAYIWVIDNYPVLSRSGVPMAMQHPSCLREADYYVANKMIPIFYWSGCSQAVKDKFAQVFLSTGSNGLIVGCWDIPTWDVEYSAQRNSPSMGTSLSFVDTRGDNSSIKEHVFINLASGYGKVALITAEKGVQNLSFHMGLSVTPASPVASPVKPTKDISKNYMSLHVSDGDNICYLNDAADSGFGLTTSRWWNDTARGTANISWSIAPGAVDLLSGAVSYLFSTASNKDSFVGAGSGWGYTLVNAYGKTLTAGTDRNTELTKFYNSSGSYQSRMGIKSQGFIWSYSLDYTANRTAELSDMTIAANGIKSTNPGFSGFLGEYQRVAARNVPWANTIEMVSGVPIFNSVNSITNHLINETTSDTYLVQLVNDINAIPTANKNFMHVFCTNWYVRPNSLAELCNRLGSGYVAVSADNLGQLYVE